MGTALASSTVVLGCAYLRRASGNLVIQGAKLGLLWMAANWLLDGLMFVSGPMKMSLGQYIKDIGIAYLMIPPITIGLGQAAHASLHRRGHAKSSGVPAAQSGGA
jgi:hypothetical protein